MHDQHSELDPDNSAFFNTRRRKKLVAKIATYVILGQLSIGILVLIAFYSVVYFQASSEAKERERLAITEYPTPSPNAGFHLKFVDHLGGTNVGTHWLPSKHANTELGEQPGSILVEAHTRFEGRTRGEVSSNVSMSFAGIGSLALPAEKESEPLLQLTANETNQIKLPPYTIQLATGFDLPDQNSGMSFSVPTEFLIEALRQNSLTARIGEHTIVFSDESMEAFRDLAAYLKPGISVPE